MQTSDSSCLHSHRACWSNFTLCKHELWPFTNTRPVFPSHTQISTQHSGGHFGDKHWFGYDEAHSFTHSFAWVCGGEQGLWVNLNGWREKSCMVCSDWAVHSSVSKSVHRSVNSPTSGGHTPSCTSCLDFLKSWRLSHPLLGSNRRIREREAAVGHLNYSLLRFTSNQMRRNHIRADLLFQVLNCEFWLFYSLKLGKSVKTNLRQREGRPAGSFSARANIHLAKSR